MDHKALGQKLFDANVRFEKLIWLAAEGGGAPSEALEGLLEDSDNSAKLFNKIGLKVSREDREEALKSPQLFVGLCNGFERWGFLAEVAFPVRSNFCKLGKGESYTSSHGLCWLHVFYAESPEDLVDKIVRKDRELLASDRKRDAEKKADKAGEQTASPQT